MNLNRINELDRAGVEEAFSSCCGSRSWAQAMIAGRPYASEDELIRQCEASWQKLSTADWLEAFAAHPKIGDIESLKKKYSSTKAWAEQEQSGVGGAAEELLKELSALNEAYERKFGYIFIVCATGKSAYEMLGILKRRIDNPPDEELKTAIEEQKKITRLRLEKL